MTAENGPKEYPHDFTRLISCASGMARNEPDRFPCTGISLATYQFPIDALQLFPNHLRTRYNSAYFMITDRQSVERVGNQQSNVTVLYMFLEGVRNGAGFTDVVRLDNYTNRPDSSVRGGFEHHKQSAFPVMQKEWVGASEDLMAILNLNKPKLDDNHGDVSEVDIREILERSRVDSEEERGNIGESNLDELILHEDDMAWLENSLVQNTFFSSEDLFHEDPVRRNSALIPTVNTFNLLKESIDYLQTHPEANITSTFVPQETD